MNPVKKSILLSKKFIFFSLAVAFILRFYLMIFVTPPDYDEIKSWHHAATVFDDGRNIYLKQPDGGFYYNYLPLWHIVLWIFLKASLKFGIEFGYLVKTFLILFDIAVLVLLHRLALKMKGYKFANILSIIFAVSPISVFIVSFGAQFEPFATIFMLLAFFYFPLGAIKENAKFTDKSMYLSAFFLGLGILVKIFPVFILPLFLMKLSGNRERIKFFIIASVPSLIFAIPYMTSAASIIGMVKYIILYKGKNSFGWGIARIFLVPALLIKTFYPGSALLGFLQSAISFLKAFAALLLLASVTAAYFISKKLNLAIVEASALVYAAIIFGIVFLFPHYLYWGLPFLLLMLNTRGISYFIFSGIYTLVYILSFVLNMAIGDPQNINFLAISWTISGFLVWATCAYIFFVYILKYIRIKNSNKIIN